MKKILKSTLYIMIFSMLVLCGCNGGTAVPEKTEISVIATIFPPYDFVRQIGGDRVNVKMLLKPGADSHSFEPSPKDIADISECDLFIYTGGENDEWVSNMLDGNEKVNSLKMVDCVDLIDEEIKEGMGGSHAHSHEHEHTDDCEGHNHTAEADDHVWTSPENAIKIVNEICEKLSAADPENSGFYEKNTEAYIKKLEELDKDFRDIVENSSRKTLVFGDRFPARYFTECYGLDYFAAFPGCSSSAEANPKTVKFLIDKIKSEKIPVILYIELSDKRMARVLSEETGAKLMLLHSAHNISAEDFESGVTYIDIMKNNEKTLKEALA